MPATSLLNPAAGYVLHKASRTYTAGPGYDGPTCARAGVTPDQVYATLPLSAPFPTSVNYWPGTWALPGFGSKYNPYQTQPNKMEENPQTRALASAYYQAGKTDTHQNDLAINVVLPFKRSALFTREPNSQPGPDDAVPTALVRWARAGHGYPWYFVGWQSATGPLLPQVHHLKCWPEYFEEIWIGTKPFEVRFNDRGYQEGDILILQGWQPEHTTDEYCPGEDDGHKQTSYPASYTGRELQALVTYKLAETHALGQHRGPLMPGWVVLGIELQ